MPQVNRTDQAELDLIGILAHLGRHSSAAADRFAEEVDQKCQLLARFPGLGEAQEELGTGVRCITIGNYVLYYRSLNGGIEILRVFHGRQNVSPPLIP